MLASLAALLFAAAAPDTAWGAIRGSVLSDPGGLPLSRAVVEATTGGQTLTDSTGAYLLPRVAAGRQILRVRSIDHEPTEMVVFVPARGELVLEVSLHHRPVVLDTVRAGSGGGGAGGAPSDPVTRGEAAITDLPAMEGPGTGLDPASPGTGSGSGGGGSGEDVLMVRGSAADLKLVLLDGAPVFAPFHMAGLIESFEPGLLSGARLYLGGAPARYDGGVSYVLDLATRGANTERWSGGASADMVAVRGEADGPLWKGAGLLLASRAVHGASLGRLEGEPFPYAYADGLARLDVSLGRGARLAVTGFTNREGVRVDTTPWRDNFLRWGNQAGSVRLRGPLFGAQGELTVAYSGFDAWLPNAGKALVVESRQQRARVALDFTRDLGALRLGYGYAWDRQWARHTVLDRSVVDAGRLAFARDTFGTVGGWYLDGLWRAAPTWLVRGGLRGDMFAGGPFISLSPRLALTWWATPRAALTLAGGRYHQLVLSRSKEPFDYGDPDLANQLGIPTVLTVASGTHLALSLDQQLTQGVRLGLEGYFKRFQGIPDPATVGNHASGVDVWVRRSEGAVSGWMGYSLAWYWSRLEAEPDSGPTRPPFTGRQTLSMGLAAQGRHGRAEVRLAYGSGLPYSSVGDAPPTGGDLPEAPLPATPGDVASPLARPPRDFLRVDVQLSRTFNPSLRGHETALTPYVRVMNALDRRDNLYYRYSRTGDLDAAPAATLPILPVLGLEWKL
jgi:hypothetical protein